MPYTPEQDAEAELYPTLGAEYFAAKEHVEGFMAHWQEEHAEALATEILKPVMDIIQERVWDAFRDHLMSDTEQNIQGAMRRMVENSVNALIGGKKWANVKYIECEYGEGKEVRETLAKLHSDPIKDGRIADLEKEVERLKKDVELYRRSGGY